MSMQVTLPQGSVNNYGTLIADAGTIEMNAKVINQNGFLQANSVQNVGGVIELVASDQLNLGADSQIIAKGDDSVGRQFRRQRDVAIRQQFQRQHWQPD